MSIFACDRTIYNANDLRAPRFIPYANDVSSSAARLQAAKDQIKALERNMKMLTDTQTKIDQAAKTDNIQCEHQDFETLRREALKNKKPKYLISSKKKVDRQWGYCSNILYENLMLIFSVSPEVSEKHRGELTKSFKDHGNFLREMIGLFETSYNKETLVFEIPRQLKEIQKKAAGAEMITKNNI